MQCYFHTPEYSKSLLIIIVFPCDRTSQQALTVFVIHVLSTDKPVTPPPSSSFRSESQILCSENGWGAGAVPLPMPSCAENRKEIKEI